MPAHAKALVCHIEPTSAILKVKVALAKQMPIHIAGRAFSLLARPGLGVPHQAGMHLSWRSEMGAGQTQAAWHWWMALGLPWGAL